MTALTQEVLKDMSLTSGSFPDEPPKPIVDAMTPDDLFRAVGIGQIKLVPTKNNGPFVTQWDVLYGDKKLGHITRSRVSPSTFYGYSYTDPSAIKGTVFTVLRYAIKWILLHARNTVELKYHDNLLKNAYVESQDEPEETLTEPELQQIVGKALGIHPRSAEMADKLQAWLEARKLNWGLQIRTIKGEERTKIPYGFDWVTTSPTTILAITLDYHENPFWQHSPVVVRLRQFLHRENCELVRRDASRWYVVEKLPHLEEAVTPKDLADVSMKPKFVPYKSPVTGDEGMALYIGFPEKITSEQWNKIYRLMKQKGYDIHDGADAQRFVYGYMQKFQNKVPPVLQDWIDTIALVLDVKAPSQSPDVKTAGATPASKVFRRAVKEWGTTHDPALAGYILPSGAMLDMSGGSGVRSSDHREVEQFFDEHFEERVDAMHAFMDMGAIRWLPEGNSLDIRKSPTPQQLTALRHLLSHVQGNNVYVDVFWPDYGSSSAEYPGKTNTDRIVRDIQTFYKTGEMKQVSQVQKFHLAAEQAVESLLRNETPAVHASYSARGTVAILLEAEQMELPLDDKEIDAKGDTGEVLSPEEIGQWLNKIGITKGYEQIDGDLGDPWVFGGTWFSQGIENDPNKCCSIIHIDGLESEGLRDYDNRSKKVLKMMAEEPKWITKVTAYVEARLPEKLMDQGTDGQPASDQETIEWCRKEATDEAHDEIGDEVAEELNANRTMPVYTTDASDPNTESWVTDHLSGILSQGDLTHEQWMEMGPAQRVCHAASYHGWDNFDSYPDHYSKQELSAKLGIEL